MAKISHDLRKTANDEEQSPPLHWLHGGAIFVSGRSMIGEIQMSKLTHLDESGAARMVDVGGKTQNTRSATAEGRIRMAPATIAAVREGNGPKGDVFATARIAGIMAAKKTGDLIPLCHPLALDSVSVDFTFEEHSICVTARASPDRQNRRRNGGAGGCIHCLANNL